GCGLYEPLSVLTQRFSQDRNVAGDVRLFNKGIGPDHCHQLLFFNQTPMTLDQREQQIEDFGLQRDNLAVAQQHSFGDVQSIRAEFVNVLSRMTHNKSQKGLKSAPRISHENHKSYRKTSPQR